MGCGRNCLGGDHSVTATPGGTSRPKRPPGRAWRSARASCVCLHFVTVGAPCPQAMHCGCSNRNRAEGGLTRGHPSTPPHFTHTCAFISSTTPSPGVNSRASANAPAARRKCPSSASRQACAVSRRAFAAGSSSSGTATRFTRGWFQSSPASHVTPSPPPPSLPSSSSPMSPPPSRARTAARLPRRRDGTGKGSMQKMGENSYWGPTLPAITGPLRCGLNAPPRTAWSALRQQRVWHGAAGVAHAAYQCSPLGGVHVCATVNAPQVSRHIETCQVTGTADVGSCTCPCACVFHSSIRSPM